MLGLASSPVLRTLRRADSIWSLVMMGGMANAAYLLARFVGDHAAWAHPGPNALQYSALGQSVMMATLVFGGLGIFLSGIAMEILGCPFTWHARGLRRRLGWELALVILIVTLVTAALLAAKHAPLWVVGVPLLALTPGMALFDPRLGTAAPLGGLALIFGLAVSSDRLIEWASYAPLAAPLLAVALVPLALSWSLSLRAGRSLLAKNLLAMASATRHPFTPMPWERRLRAQTLADTRWSGGAIRTATDRRASLGFERWGWSRGTWPLGRLGATGIAVLIVLAFSALLAWRSNLGSAGAIKLVFALTGDTAQLKALGLSDVGRHSLLRMVTSGAIYIVFLIIGERMQPALRPGHLYPMSRAERADLLWRGALENWLPQFARLALAFLALFLASGLLSGSPFSPRPPHFVATLALIAAGLPFFQLTSGLRELYPGERLAPWQVLMIMITLASGSCVLLSFCQDGLHEISPTFAWLAVLLSFALAIPSQFALRQFLRKRLASMPLV